MTHLYFSLFKGRLALRWNQTPRCNN